MNDSSSLKRKAISGLLWSSTDLIANQGIQFFIQIILARLLLPEHFGLIGMILIFISISNSIIDSGFTQALIKEKNPGQDDYSTVFYFNLLLAFLIYMVLFISSEAISSFFGEPQLISILRILSLVLIINSFGIIQRAILIKNVDFRSQTKINIIAGTVSGMVAIVFALFGFGVWSLVLKSLSMQFIQTLLLWFNNKWIPSFVFSVKSFKKLFGFGSKLLISGLIDTLYNNLYFVIIGKFFTASQLGYYTNAVKLRDVASQSITTSVQRVTYPVLSKIQGDEEKLKYGYRKVIKTTTFIIFPFMLGLAAISSPLIYSLLGDKWMPSVKYLQLLCIAGMLYPLHAINLNILQVKGRSDLFLVLELLKKLILTILIILVLWLKLGVIGLIWGTVLHSFIALFINTYFSAREISYSVKEQLKDITPIFLISIFMAGIVYYVGLLLSGSNLITMIFQIGIGILLYICFSKIARVQELNTLYSLIKPLIKKILFNLHLIKS
ncbi:lipopolysaccharide biosynthesis protein [Neobacillus bataviensis]|uniref:lipopolysaccharide biosynthesis protein n=1 Tax=Neobacillus bataviensis TaxID=220685 RepID=UPI001CBB5543|nr:lipopolysaccharide biosynthesis protein [Neobacillus bataviensis]